MIHSNPNSLDTASTQGYLHVIPQDCAWPYPPYYAPWPPPVNPPPYIYPQTPINPRVGWICPKCNTVYSPDVTFCGTCLNQFPNTGKIFSDTGTIICNKTSK